MKLTSIKHFLNYCENYRQQLNHNDDDWWSWNLMGTPVFDVNGYSEDGVRKVIIYPLINNGTPYLETDFSKQIILEDK